MKRYLSVFFLICFMLSFFSACAKPKLPDSENDDNLDFHGSEFTVIMSVFSSLFKSAGVTAANDRFNQRLYDIQNKYNLVFNENRVDNVAMSFISGSLTGTVKADMVYDAPLNLYEMYKINSLIPADEIINDIHEGKYGTAKFTDATVFNGRQYGVFPYLHDSPPNISGLLALKMDIVDEFGLIDPHEYIESEEWDWEHFRRFLENATFSDGSNQYVGMVLSGYRNGINAYATFIYSNGGKLMDYTSMSGYKAVIDSPEAIEAMEFISSLFATPYADCPARNDEATYVTELGIPSFQSEEHEIHALRVPYGPNGSPDDISAIMYDCRFWAFPVFSSYSTDEVYTITDELFEPLSELYSNGWKDYILDNYFYDDSDYDYYCRAADNINFVDGSIFEDLFYPTFQRVIGGSETVRSSLESLIGSVQTLIDEKYNK